MFFFRLLLMDTTVLIDQQNLTFISISVDTECCQGVLPYQWPIRTDSEGDLKESVLMAYKDEEKSPLVENVQWGRRIYCWWLFLPMRSRHCNTYRRTVWIARETMLIKKTHLVSFHKSILVSLWTIQLSLIQSHVSLLVSPLTHWRCCVNVLILFWHCLE